MLGTIACVRRPSPIRLWASRRRRRFWTSFDRDEVLRSRVARDERDQRWLLLWRQVAHRESSECTLLGPPDSAPSVLPRGESNRRVPPDPLRRSEGTAPGKPAGYWRNSWRRIGSKRFCGRPARSPPRGAPRRTANPLAARGMPVSRGPVCRQHGAASPSATRGTSANPEPACPRRRAALRPAAAGIPARPAPTCRPAACRRATPGPRARVAAASRRTRRAGSARTV
jgi:hypothetical protein